MNRLIIFCAAALLLCTNYTIAAGTWTALNKPGANETQIRAINGNNIVGRYSIGNVWHGFIYNGGTWTTLDMPGAGGSTYVYGISGSNIAGNYNDASSRSHGFIYNMTAGNWTTVDKPGAAGTAIYGIEGNNLVGWDYESAGHGFLYNGTTWTTLDNPNAAGWDTNINGISGNNIVGSYDRPTARNQGFIYNTTSGWTPLNMAGARGTSPQAINGDNIGGYYWDEDGALMHGFLYNGGTWTILDMPGAMWTCVYGINGNSLVGAYYDAAQHQHGFIYTIPEPATLLLLCLGAVMFRRSEKCER
jgi:hypothetical protein